MNFNDEIVSIEISEQNKGSNNPNFGNHYTHSEKTKHQMYRDWET